MFKILLLTLPLYLFADNLPIKIIAIYNNELAFRIDVDGLDIKIYPLNIKPLPNKINTIRWYIKKQIENNTKITIDMPKKHNHNMYGNIYFNGKLLKTILKSKHLIK